MSETLVVKCPLQDKKVKLEPIIRKGGWLQDINKDHDGAFMFSGSFLRLKGLPVDGLTKKKPQVLTQEELAWFESSKCPLGLKEGDLSPYKMEKNFWTQFEVKIPKDGLQLDLNDVHDYLRYKFLLCYTNIICPSPEQAYENLEYKFTFADEQHEIQKQNKRGEIKKNAWIEFGKIEGSMEKLRNVLTIYGRKPLGSAKQEFLIAEVNKIVEENPVKFLEIVRDKDMDIKILINKAVSVGALRKQKSSYSLPGGDIIGRTESETIEFLKDKMNQDIYLTIKAQIEA